MRNLSPLRAFFSLSATALVALATFQALQSRDPVHAARPPLRVTVRQGDTLWAIAQRVTHDADPRDAIDRIVADNHLNSSPYIYPGQALLVRP